MGTNLAASVPPPPEALLLRAFDAERRAALEQRWLGAVRAVMDRDTVLVGEFLTAHSRRSPTLAYECGRALATSLGIRKLVDAELLVAVEIPGRERYVLFRRFPGAVDALGEPVGR